jgi:hypothetical protein
MINEAKRLVVFEKSGGECGHCGKELSFNNRSRKGRGAWEVEHLHPRAHGGTDHLNNLVAACWPCNIEKGTRSARAHRLAVAPDRIARISRRRWRLAGQALLPGIVVGGLAYLYLKGKTPNEEQMRSLSREEQNRIWWRNLLIPVGAGLATIMVAVVVSEAFRRT